MQKYDLEFILSAQDVSEKALKNSLCEFGEGLEIVALAQNPAFKSREFKIHILTQEPTFVFDACTQFGRLKSVKVEEK